MPSGHELYHFTSPEISGLFKTAPRTFKSPFFDIISAPKAKETARLLVATPRKLGNAPVRNKIRRRLKAIFYEQKMFLRDEDMILIAKKGSLSLPFAQLQEIFVKAVSTAKERSLAS